MATYRLRDLEASIHEVVDPPDPTDRKYLWFRCPQPHCQGAAYDGDTHRIGWKLDSPWHVVSGSTVDDLTIKGSLRILDDTCRGHWVLENGVLKDAD